MSLLNTRTSLRGQLTNEINHVWLSVLRNLASNQVQSIIKLTNYRGKAKDKKAKKKKKKKKKKKRTKKNKKKRKKKR